MKWLFIGQINKVRMLIKETKQSQKKEHRQEVASDGRTDHSVKAFYLDNTLEKNHLISHISEQAKEKLYLGKNEIFLEGLLKKQRCSVNL